MYNSNKCSRGREWLIDTEELASLTTDEERETFPFIDYLTGLIEELEAEES